MRFIPDQHFKSIFKNTLSQFSIKAITSTSTFLATFLISYFLGLSVFGSFTKIVTFVSLFYLILDFGLNSIFLKLHFKEAYIKFGNLLFLRLLLSLVLILIVSGLASILPYNQILSIGFSNAEKIGVLVFSLTLLSYGLNLSFNAFLQKNLSYHFSVIPNLISSLLSLVLIGIGILNKNLNLILFSYFISQLLLCLLIYRSVKRKFKINIVFNNFFNFSRNLLDYSSPIALMLVFNIIYAKADTMILSFYKPSFDVGVYGFAYRIFEFFIAIPAFFSNSIYPVLLNETNNENKFFELVKKYLTFLSLISLPLAGILFFASPILSLIRTDFSYSVLPIKILSISLPFFFVTSLMQWILIIKGKIKFLVFTYFISMVLNILLNIIFIPKYSYLASSVITVLSEGIVFIFMLIYFVLQKEKIIRKTK